MKTGTFYPEFNDEGEVIASWGEAKLITFLDGNLVLRGGSEEDRAKAKKWISMFMPRDVVSER